MVGLAPALAVGAARMAPPGAPADWPRLPGYDILDVLGKGGLGVVYLARQRALDRLVAVKVVRPELLADPAVVRRFRREARAVARLAHPHIVAVHDAGPVAGSQFLALEYVPGTDLNRLIRSHGPLPAALACVLVRQAALGLAHAHAHGFVHRDIKPANLLVSGGGVSGEWSKINDTHQVKVADFGLARLPRSLEEEASGSTLGLVGTPDFVAPEQIETPGRADARADLYGLGGTFYFLLTGRVPFPGGTLVQKLDRQRWAEPVPLRHLRPEVPAGIAATVHRLLAKRPDDRFHSAAHLAAVLEPLCRGGSDASAATSGPVADTAATVYHSSNSTAAVSGWRCVGGHLGPVTHLAGGARARQVVSSGADRRVRIWDLETTAEAGSWEVPEPIALAVLDDGHVLALGWGDAVLELRDASTGCRIQAWRHPGAAPLAAAIAADGRQVLTADADLYVRLWEVGTNRAKRRIGGTVIERHWGPIGAVAFSPDGRRALSGSADRTARLWELDTGRELRTFRHDDAAVVGVAFLPDGRRAVTAAGPGLRLWDIESGALLARLDGCSGAVRCLALTKDGCRAATGSEQGTVQLWDLEAVQEIGRFTGHLGPVLAVAFTADGRHVLSGSADRSVRAWTIY